jgi:polyisoprenoid-binding protein YceI
VSDLTAANGTWVIDAAHTNIGFSARHLMVSKVRGHFTAFEGGFTIDADNVGASSANLSIQAASIGKRVPLTPRELKMNDIR